MLPGDTKPRNVDSMIRVNHAGEYGAKRIYQGQLAILKNSASAPVIEHMAEQEEAHLRYFSDLISKRKIRPTAFMPIWHVGGFALGAASALLGEKAAMACTVAVEEVIDEHYQQQVDTLPSKEKPLKDKIKQFQAEELEHRDIGLEHHAEQAPAYPILSGVIKSISRKAIWLSERI